MFYFLSLIFHYFSKTIGYSKINIRPWVRNACLAQCDPEVLLQQHVYYNNYFSFIHNYDYIAQYRKCISEYFAVVVVRQ